VKDLPFHEVANLFPLIEGKEFEQLKADIKEHGQRLPVWTYRGRIIDGRNRYRACRELGMEPSTQEWDGNGSLVAFVWSLNGPRRHLGKGQLAAVAVEMLPWLEKEARERQRQAGKVHGKGRPKAKLPELIPEAKRDDGEARKQAAKLAGTNARYVSMAKAIKEADPEAFEQVKAGKVNLHQAKHRVIKRQRQREYDQQEETARGGQWWGLEGCQNWPGRHFEELQRQTLADPEFSGRQHALEEKKRRVAELEKELAALQKTLTAVRAEARDEEWRLKFAIREAIAERHGYPANEGFSGFCIKDPATQERLAAGDAEEVREILS
jgi:hypothetical protein